MAAAVMTSMDLCQARNDKNTLVPVTLAPSLSLGGDSSVPTSTLKLSIDRKSTRLNSSHVD